MKEKRERKRSPNTKFIEIQAAASTMLVKNGVFETIKVSKLNIKAKIKLFGFV